MAVHIAAGVQEAGRCMGAAAMVTGTAFRTNAAPVETTTGDTGFVYAIHPPIPFQYGAATHVLLVTSPAVGDTCVYACSPVGEMEGFVASAATVHHDETLLGLGYELEPAPLPPLPVRIPALPLE